MAVNTGARTQFGWLAQKLAERRVPTSFDRGIKGFIWLMIRFMTVMVAAVFLIIGIMKHSWVDALLFAGAVLVRERAANTAIGAGWACPHGRVPGEGDLSCAVGWSPAGIDWNAPDGKPGHVVIMNCIPDSEKNAYLKEISTLAKAIQAEERLRDFGAEKELAGVRLRLIGALTAAAETVAPDAKARMIRLEAKQTAATPGPALSAAYAGPQIVPLSIVIAPGVRPVVLSQHLAKRNTIPGKRSGIR